MGEWSDSNNQGMLREGIKKLRDLTAKGRQQFVGQLGLSGYHRRVYGYNLWPGREGLLIAAVLVQL